MLSIDALVGEDFDTIQAGAILDLNVFSSASEVSDSNPLTDSILPSDDATINVGMRVYFGTSHNRRVGDLSSGGNLAISTNNAVA